MDDRRTAVLARVCGGETIASVASDLGLSKQRIEQIIAPEKHAARQAIKREVAAGRMVRPSVCSECGTSGRIDAHHPDYGKPLDVEWLCKRCHANRHWPVRAVREEVDDATLMTAQQYRRLRVQVGSQAAVARKLGVHVQTISQRERGLLRIGPEAEFAILWLERVLTSERSRLQRGIR